MKTLPALLIAILITTGCDSGTKELSSDSQRIYSDQVDNQQQLLDQAKKTKNELAIKKAEEAATDFLKGKTTTADNWKATVEEVRSMEITTDIIGQYKTQTYTMRLADPKLKAWAATLKSGDNLIFSGSLGKERSITIEGGLRNPEFTFFPVSIRTESETTDHLQSDESIANARLLEEEQERRGKLITMIDTLCEESTKAKAINKRSADFSFLNREVTQTDTNTWRYTNNVTLQNAYGAKITYRVSCTVNTRVGPGGEHQARVSDLKIFQ